MGGVGDAKSDIDQSLGTMASLDKIAFARIIQPTQQLLYLKPLAEFPNRANLPVAGW